MGVYIFFNWMNIEIQIQVFEGSICIYIYGCHLFIYSTSVADSTVGQAFPPVLGRIGILSAARGVREPHDVVVVEMRFLLFDPAETADQRHLVGQRILQLTEQRPGLGVGRVRIADAVQAEVLDGEHVHLGDSAL